MYLYLYLEVFLMLLPRIGRAQEPERPDLYYVTVDPETGYDIIVWLPSPSSNVTYYEIGIAQINPPDPFYLLPIGQVYPPDTEFINTNTESGLHSVGYSVWATNDMGGGLVFPSLFDEPDSTIFLPEPVIDSCSATITLEWNDYNTWRGQIEEYNILWRIDGGPWSVIASLDEGINSYTRTLQADRNYDIYVEVAHTDGIRRSKSNMQSVNTDYMNPGPEWINADYATISEDNTIDLSFTIGSSGTYQYSLLRSSGIAGPYTTVYEFESSDTRIAYRDPVAFQSGVFYYRLVVLNSCGLPGDSSNMANNILLNGTLNNLNVILDWNDYSDWYGGVQNYTVTRTVGVENPVVDVVYTGPMTGFNDDISLLVNHLDPYENRICYRVEAVENVNKFSIQGRSISNQTCVSVNSEIRVPNAIIPNDPDPEISNFEPIFEFEPEHYEIIVYNRLGLKIWEGSGPWDGTVNGNFVPEGVYLYYIRIFNRSSDIVELNGKLTIIYR
ncbi:MAG: gliding motility-associated C-terminal domain-containing protein [Bacteroidales bacterium]|nr:gliding motility-associated C-terminal domain-containing protein [Bacteroidales bacterium]